MENIQDKNKNEQGKYSPQPPSPRSNFNKSQPQDRYGKVGNNIEKDEPVAQQLNDVATDEDVDALNLNSEKDNDKSRNTKTPTKKAQPDGELDKDRLGTDKRSTHDYD